MSLIPLKQSLSHPGESLNKLLLNTAQAIAILHSKPLKCALQTTILLHSRICGLGTQISHNGTKLSFLKYVSLLQGLNQFGRLQWCWTHLKISPASPGPGLGKPKSWAPMIAISEEAYTGSYQWLGFPPSVVVLG